MPVPLRDAKSGVLVEEMRWYCGGCASQHPGWDCLEIWLHLARCPKLEDSFRESWRTVLWINWGFDEVRRARFRRLMMSITVCGGRYGCWWCHDLARKENHPVRGQWLVVATGLAGFQLAAPMNATYHAYQAEANRVRRGPSEPGKVA